MPKFLLLLHMLLCVQIQDFDNDKFLETLTTWKKSPTSEDHFTMNYLLDMNTLSLFLKMTLTNLTFSKNILVPPLKNQPPPSPKCYFSVSFLSNPWSFHANHTKAHKKIKCGLEKIIPIFFLILTSPPWFLIFNFAQIYIPEEALKF